MGLDRVEKTLRRDCPAEPVETHEFRIFDAPRLHRFHVVEERKVRFDRQTGHVKRTGDPAEVVAVEFVIKVERQRPDQFGPIFGGMVGNPGVIAVADAVLKDFGGFDKELAFEAMKNSAVRPDRGQDLRMKYGYIPCDLFNEAVAYDMEYAIADGAVADAAKKLGKTGDYEYFLERSHSYRNFFDPQTGFMRGKDSKGNFRTPFSPFASTHRADDYCEGNAWQYTWLAPHDFDGLVGCFGSKEAFLGKLDSLFIVSSDIEGGNTSPDISGLIGQYAHGNEPSHHILYFYTVAGQPWKTAEKVREVLSTMYHDAPDGLSGNEDVGQMSAWYILSALGFYQTEAGGRYWFGSPLFDEAEIKVPGGVFTVRTVDNSEENIYIQSVTLNGRPYTNPYIDFKDIKAGGTLEFRMGPEPNDMAFSK